MIKIIHAITDTNIGGAGIWVLNYLKSYDKKSYDVSCAIPEDSALKPMIEALGVKVHEVKFIKDKSFSKEGIKEFSKLFKKEKPQIVHSHASLSARIAAKRLKIKVVNTRHCLEDPKKFPKKLIYSFINNHLSDIVIGVSEAAYKNLLCDGTKEKKLRLVYNGVFAPEKLSDDERQIIRKRLSIPDENIVVGIIARMEPVKNHELFINAAKMIADKRENVTFLVVGGGTVENKIKELTKKLKISDRVIFTGYQKNIRDYVNIIDILTLTSEKEALSISLIEGMYLEKPCVSTDAGGPSEVVLNGVTGFITENKNAAAFSDAVTKLVDDAGLRIKMGKEGRKRALEIFTPEAMQKTLDKVYKELI